MILDFMTKAIDVARLSGEDIPVGAVVVKDNKILAAFHNEKEKRKDVSAHAEILALREASKVLGDWRLSGCDLYVTLEPCPMCASAILQSRVSNLYFGSYDNVYGAFSVFPELKNILNSKLNVKGGIMESECDKLINEYFEGIRK